LQPLGEYGHRLVLDLYPQQELDALALLALGKPVSEPAAAVPQYARLITVAIDAGHGGEDPGAIGASGTHEKDVTLAVARKLKQKLDAVENMRGVLIRDGDYFIPLAKRVNRARAVKADLFVSIHADAFIRPQARGSSVFALSENGASSVAARWLAKKENEADLVGGVNIDVKDPFLKRTLLDLSQTATINDSLKLGRSVLKEIGGVNTLHKPHVEQAGFAVLKAPDIPSILIETAFISNPEEEKRLKDDAYQEKLVNAIVTGIRDYFEQNPLTTPTRLTRNP
jgi:N-acetylmuramoyl-L-alanine amidase